MRAGVMSYTVPCCACEAGVSSGELSWWCVICGVIWGAFLSRVSMVRPVKSWRQHGLASPGGCQ